MTTGTKTLNHGDLIAIAFDFTTRGGADSVTVTYGPSNPIARNLPCVMNNTTGAFAKQGGGTPNVYIKFDDGTIGWIDGGYFFTLINSNVLINVASATADEYGNLINLPETF